MLASRSVSSDTKLILLFLIICLALIFRIKVEGTGYISLDSVAYLEVTQNLLDGKGLYITNRHYTPAEPDSNPLKLYTAWPVGYPLAIYAIAKILSIDPFTASKITNFIFLALIFWILRVFDQKHAYVHALLFCSFAGLEIFSYTWSDGPFIFASLLLLMAIDRYWNHPDYLNQGLILLSLLLMFLIRYVGFVGCIFTGLLSIYFFIKGAKTQAVQLSIITILDGIFIALYFYVNFLLTTSPWGGKRVMPEVETAEYFTLLLLKGLFNTPLLIRNYYFQKPFDWLFFFLAVIQLITFVFIYFKFVRNTINSRWHATDRLTILLFFFGLLYLLILIALRTISPFEKFNYRLLAPFNFSWLLSLLLYLANPVRQINFKGIANILTYFFLFSLVMNLPKHFILEKASLLMNWLK